MSQIRVNDDELQARVRLTKNLSADAREDVWKHLRKAALDVEARVKRAMPVDTGRARASFGTWDDHIKLGKAGLKKNRVRFRAAYSRAWNQALSASPADSIHQEDEAGLRIVVGSNLPYIEFLNSGSYAKRQAPVGFIDMAVYEAEKGFTAALAEVLNGL